VMKMRWTTSCHKANLLRADCKWKAAQLSIGRHYRHEVRILDRLAMHLGLFLERMSPGREHNLVGCG
jgi:hypothetical protein